MSFLLLMLSVALALSPFEKKALEYYREGNLVGALELLNAAGYEGPLREEIVNFFLLPPSAERFRGGEPKIRLKLAQGFKSLSLRCGSKVHLLYGGGKVPSLKFKSRGCLLILDGVELPLKNFEASLLSEQGLPALVLNLPLEEYLKGVVAGEVYAGWSAEALKAQAVAARTFALYNAAKREKKPYDLDASTNYQRFLPGSVPPSVEAAVEQTRGEVLTFKGKLIYAMYSSNDGGVGFSFKELLGLELPYLRGAPTAAVCDRFWELRWSRWEKKLPFEKLKELAADAGFKGKICHAELSGGPPRLVLFSCDGRGRLELPAAFFARLELGVPSSRFFVAGREKGALILKGRGFGHGLGMSQWGAFCLAQRGWDYRRILRFYYSGAELTKLY